MISLIGSYLIGKIQYRGIEILQIMQSPGQYVGIISGCLFNASKAALNGVYLCQNHIPISHDAHAPAFFAHLRDALS